MFFFGHTAYFLIKESSQFSAGASYIRSAPTCLRSLPLWCWHFLIRERWISQSRLMKRVHASQQTTTMSRFFLFIYFFRPSSADAKHNAANFFHMIIGLKNSAFYAHRFSCSCAQKCKKILALFSPTPPPPLFISLIQMFLVALSFAYFAKALSGSYMKSTITQLERRFDIPSYLIGVIDGSFEIGE